MLALQLRLPRAPPHPLGVCEVTLAEVEVHATPSARVQPTLPAAESHEPRLPIEVQRCPRPDPNGGGAPAAKRPGQLALSPRANRSTHPPHRLQAGGARTHVRRGGRVGGRGGAAQASSSRPVSKHIPRALRLRSGRKVERGGYGRQGCRCGSVGRDGAAWSCIARTCSRMSVKLHHWFRARRGPRRSIAAVARCRRCRARLRSATTCIHVRHARAAPCERHTREAPSNRCSASARARSRLSQVVKARATPCCASLAAADFVRSHTPTRRSQTSSCACLRRQAACSRSASRCRW